VNIVVSGYVASYPIAGFFWHYMSYVMGLRALGHDVWYIEDSGDDVWGWDTVANAPDPALAAGVRFLEQEMAYRGLGRRWAVRVVPHGLTHGMTAAEVDDVLAAADVFVNVSCVAPPRPEYARIPHRLGIDTDPVFTQIRIARGDPRRSWIPEFHTRLFTFGVPPLPASRHEWTPTRQPVVLDMWEDVPAPRTGSAFTTVAAWQAYPSESWGGSTYQGKDVSFRRLIDLPRRTDVPLVVAVGGRGDTRAATTALRSAGWQVEDGIRVSASTASYRGFIYDSLGEIGVAKDGYVAARSGWFSERTCCYLAAGRPAVVQDTGFSDWLPTGEGLLSFTTAADAADALEAVRDDAGSHSLAARRIAREHFDARQVCDDLLRCL
jgi:hypothetical protein